MQLNELSETVCIHMDVVETWRNDFKSYEFAGWVC